MIAILTGKVIWYDDIRRCGGLTANGSDKELFFTHIDILDSEVVEPDQEVDFEQRGNRAIEIVTIIAMFGEKSDEKEEEAATAG